MLPSGPTIADEVASAAFWLGLMNELGATLEHIPSRIAFAHAQSNLYAAARDGLSARFTWLDKKEVLAQPLVLDHLLPLAQAGLDRAGVDRSDSRRYLAIVDERVRKLRTGAHWMLRSLADMKERGTPGVRMTALVASMIARQQTGRVVSEWDLARLDESNSAFTGREKVSQYMQTDIFTVRPDDPIALVAELMGWERIRHVAVEDDKDRIVGLVSYRAVLRFLAELAKHPPLAEETASPQSTLCPASCGRSSSPSPPIPPRSTPSRSCDSTGWAACRSSRTATSSPCSRRRTSSGSPAGCSPRSRRPPT